MFDASVMLAERILFAVDQSLVVAMRVMKPTGPELKRAPESDDVRDHWPPIRKTLRTFPVFDLDVAQKTLRDEARRHLATEEPPKLETPTGAKAAVADPADDLTTSEPGIALARLVRRYRKAYLSFKYAELKAGRELDDKTAYETICRGEFDEQILDQHPELRELSDYSPPDSLKTWREYVSKTRTDLKENKYDRRHTITPGRSVVKGDQIEHQVRDE